MTTRLLGYRAPLAARPLMRFLGDRAIPGVESFDGRTYRRSIRTPEDRPLVIEISLDPAETQVTFTADQIAAPEYDRAEDVARRLLDLDADPSIVDAALAADPTLRPLVHATPGNPGPRGSRWV